MPPAGPREMDFDTVSYIHPAITGPGRGLLKRPGAGSNRDS